MRHALVTSALITGLLTCFATASFAAKQAQKDIKLQNDEEKTLYALGYEVSRNLASFNLSESELAFVKAGFGDGVLGKKAQVETQPLFPKIRELQTARMEQIASREKQLGATFIEKAATEKDATKLPSGMVLKTVNQGSGDSPKESDTVKVHYHGTLMDGRVFDSSVQRNEPATFAVNAVIPCWTEGLQQMKVGGKAQFVCPPSVAYGDRGSPPAIGPGATLLFEVELLSIEK